MYKLILIFQNTEEANLDEIEHRWSHEFVPLVEGLEGVRLVSISRVNKAISPEANVHLIHELYFDDLESLDAAMRSPRGQRAGNLLIEIAGEAVQVYFAEHKEDKPTPADPAGNPDLDA